MAIGYGVWSLCLYRCCSRAPASALSGDAEKTLLADFSPCDRDRDLAQNGGSCAAVENASPCACDRADANVCGVAPLPPSADASPEKLASSPARSQCGASSRRIESGGGVEVPRQDPRCSFVRPVSLPGAGLATSHGLLSEQSTFGVENAVTMIVRHGDSGWLATEVVVV